MVLVLVEEQSGRVGILALTISSIVRGFLWDSIEKSIRLSRLFLESQLSLSETVHNCAELQESLELKALRIFSPLLRIYKDNKIYTK